MSLPRPSSGTPGSIAPPPWLALATPPTGKATAPCPCTALHVGCRYIHVVICQLPVQDSSASVLSPAGCREPGRCPLQSICHARRRCTREGASAATAVGWGGRQNRARGGRDAARLAHACFMSLPLLPSAAPAGPSHASNCGNGGSATHGPLGKRRCAPCAVHKRHAERRQC